MMTSAVNHGCDVVWAGPCARLERHPVGKSETALVLILDGSTEQRSPSNELSEAMLRDVDAALTCFETLNANALVLSSAKPGVFSAGADLRGLYDEMVAKEAAGTSHKEQQRLLRASLLRIHALMTRIDTLPAVVVMHTAGLTFGGGLELLLTGDIIVAERAARFAFPELRLGLIPGFGGIPRLRRELHNGAIRDLLLTGRSVGAERAYQLGLVQHLAGEGAGLITALRLAAQAQKQSPRAVVAMKRFLKNIPDAELIQEIDTFVDMAFDGSTLKEALARFVGNTSAMPYLPS